MPSKICIMDFASRCFGSLPKGKILWQVVECSWLPIHPLSLFLLLLLHPLPQNPTLNLGIISLSAEHNNQLECANLY